MELTEIEALLQNCQIHLDEGKIRTAKDEASETLQAAHEFQNTPIYDRCLLLLVSICNREFNTREARHWLDILSSKNPDPAIQRRIKIQQALVSILEQQPEAGERLLQEVVFESQESRDQEAEVQALQNLSLGIYIQRGWFHRALALIDQANSIMRLNGNSLWTASLIKASVAYFTGDRQQSRGSLDELLPLVKPGTRIAGVYYYLWAGLAIDEEEFDKADEYLRLALRIANQTGEVDLSVVVRLEYSRLQRAKGQSAAARQWAEDALRYGQQYQQNRYQGIALLHASRSSWDLEDYEKAFAYLDAATEKFVLCGDEYHQAYTSLLRAAWSEKTNQTDSPEAWLQASRAIFQGGYTFLLERERSLAFPLISNHLRTTDPRSRGMAETLLELLANIPPQRLTIFGLGQFAVLQGRTRISDQAWVRRRAGELFRFLLLQPGYSAGREEIIDSLWPDSPPSAAADLFHQATSALRRVLEPDLPDKFPSRYLFVEGERVFIKLPPGSMIDFERFERSLPAAIQSQEIIRLEKVLDAYTAELFPLDRYADWSSLRREHLAQAYLQGCLALAQAYLRQQKCHQALSTARRVVNHDPWSEDGVFLIMQAYLQLGDAPHALKAYLDLENTLRTELNITPREDLRLLAEKIRSR